MNMNTLYCLLLCLSAKWDLAHNLHDDSIFCSTTLPVWSSLLSWGRGERSKRSCLPFYTSLTIHQMVLICKDGPYLSSRHGKQGTLRGGATAQIAEKLAAQRGWDWLEDYTAICSALYSSASSHLFWTVSLRLWEDRGLTILHIQHPLLWTFTEQLLWWKTVKRLPPMRVWSLGREVPLEKEMATHSSILAWKIPWTEEPGRLQSMGSQGVRHDWVTSLYIHCHIYFFFTDL